MLLLLLSFLVDIVAIFGCVTILIMLYNISRIDAKTILVELILYVILLTYFFVCLIHDCIVTYAYCSGLVESTYPYFLRYHIIMGLELLLLSIAYCVWAADIINKRQKRLSMKVYILTPLLYLAIVNVSLMFIVVSLLISLNRNYKTGIGVALLTTYHIITINCAAPYNSLCYVAIIFKLLGTLLLLWRPIRCRP